MIVAQHRFSDQPAIESVSVALAVIAFFLLVAPYAFRRLFPAGATPSALRLLTYVALGGVSPLIAYVIPHRLGIGTTFLANGVNNLVVSCLFWVGGFGLARDIELEERWRLERRRAEDAQLVSLKNHLDPHFLFNTLNAIAEWCREDPEVAERAILQLSSILREILAGVERASWPLLRDLELVEALFALHRIRDPDRFETSLSIPRDLPSVDIPPMLLLPLAENAMKHGPGAGHRGRVELTAAVVGDQLAIELTNPGPFAGERPEGHGLTTQKKRLALAYGARARLEIRREGERTRVALRLPLTGVSG